MGWYGCPGTRTVWKITILFLQLVSAALGTRHAVYWNSTNTRLSQGDFSIEVNPGDYLDILCPHYPPETPTSAAMETLALYLVREQEFQGCQDTQGAVKRWECNRPRAPLGPVRFSEKFQRFTPFSMGFEFLPGHHYYYSSMAIEDSPQLPCMKLRVTVCCETEWPQFEHRLNHSGKAGANQGTSAPYEEVISSAGRAQLSLLLFIPLFIHSSI